MRGWQAVVELHSGPKVLTADRITHCVNRLVSALLRHGPTWLLTIFGELYFLYVAPLPGVGRGATPTQIMQYLHFDLFFSDPLWNISHNFFHSLLINTLLIGIGYWAYKNAQRWGLMPFWLAISMQLHTLIDIVMHSSDGPLIFFLINWTYRFRSPLSYWESSAYGVLFMIFEYLLDTVIVIYFIVQRRCNLRQKVMFRPIGGE